MTSTGTGAIATSCRPAGGILLQPASGSPPSLLNDIYRVLDRLRYRTMGSSSANYKVATPLKGGSTTYPTPAPPPDDPLYHWYRDTWYYREGTTQQAEWQAAKDDALARLQRTDYAPDNSSGGFPPSRGYGYGYWPSSWLWAAAAWVWGYQLTVTYYGWPPTVPYFYYAGYYGQAQKRLAMMCLQTLNPGEFPPPPTLRHS